MVEEEFKTFNHASYQKNLTSDVDTSIKRVRVAMNNEADIDLAKNGINSKTGKLDRCKKILVDLTSKLPEEEKNCKIKVTSKLDS